MRWDVGVGLGAASGIHHLKEPRPDFSQLSQPCPSAPPYNSSQPREPSQWTKQPSSPDHDLKSAEMMCRPSSQLPSTPPCVHLSLPILWLNGQNGVQPCASFTGIITLQQSGGCQRCAVPFRLCSIRAWEQHGRVGSRPRERAERACGPCNSCAAFLYSA